MALHFSVKAAARDMRIVDTTNLVPGPGPSCGTINCLAYIALQYEQGAVQLPREGPLEKQQLGLLRRYRRGGRLSLQLACVFLLEPHTRKQSGCKSVGIPDSCPSIQTDVRGSERIRS